MSPMLYWSGKITSVLSQSANPNKLAKEADLSFNSHQKIVNSKIPPEDKIFQHISSSDKNHELAFEH